MAEPDRTTTVVFEPWGEERVVAAGDHIDVDLPTAPDDSELSLCVEHREGTVILHQEVIEPIQIWDSSGRDLGG